MKLCPNCNHTLNDDATFCANCGCSVANFTQAQQPVQDNNNNFNQQNYNQNNFNQNNFNQNNFNQQNYAPQMPMNNFDHTAEFSAQDVSEHKLYALITYVTPVMGIILSSLACRNDNSAFLKFHNKQALKIVVLQIILIAFLIIPFLGYFAAAICEIILLVVQIICFVRVCKNKSIEPPIVRGFGFLN